MTSNTPFFNQIHRLQFLLKKKMTFFKKIVILSLFFLFLGFVFGNLFGTFLNYFRSFTDWDGLIIIFILVIIEIINYLNYKSLKNGNSFLLNFFSSRKNFGRRGNNQKDSRKHMNSIIKILHFSKIGLLMGFFIDAFKVGS